MDSITLEVSELHSDVSFVSKLAGDKNLALQNAFCCLGSNVKTFINAALDFVTEKTGAAFEDRSWLENAEACEFDGYVLQMLFAHAESITLVKLAEKDNVFPANDKGASDLSNFHRLACELHARVLCHIDDGDPHECPRPSGSDPEVKARFGMKEDYLSEFLFHVGFDVTQRAIESRALVEAQYQNAFSVLDKQRDVLLSLLPRNVRLSLEIKRHFKDMRENVRYMAANTGINLPWDEERDGLFSLPVLTSSKSCL